MFIKRGYARMLSHLVLKRVKRSLLMLAIWSVQCWLLLTLSSNAFAASNTGASATNCAQLPTKMLIYKEDIVKRLYLRFKFAPLLFLLLLGVVFTGCGSSAIDSSKLDTLSIVVRRVTNGQDNTSPIIFQKTIHGSQKVQKVFLTITASHQVTSSENYNCPTGSPPYEFVDIRFQQQGKIIAEATVEVISCAFWYLRDVSSGNTDEYCCASSPQWANQWAQWRKEFGLPEFDSTKIPRQSNH